MLDEFYKNFKSEIESLEMQMTVSIENVA